MARLKELLFLQTVKHFTRKTNVSSYHVCRREEWRGREEREREGGCG